jgi:hypothetical protein
MVNKMNIEENIEMYEEYLNENIERLKEAKRECRDKVIYPIIKTYVIFYAMLIMHNCFYGLNINPIISKIGCNINLFGMSTCIAYFITVIRPKSLKMKRTISCIEDKYFLYENKIKELKKEKEIELLAQKESEEVAVRKILTSDSTQNELTSSHDNFQKKLIRRIKDQLK